MSDSTQALPRQKAGQHQQSGNTENAIKATQLGTMRLPPGTLDESAAVLFCVPFCPNAHNHALRIKEP
jgi:hypothetical protein